jgi:hypothetical protein
MALSVSGSSMITGNDAPKALSFEIFLVFVQCCCSNSLEFSTRQVLEY